MKDWLKKTLLRTLIAGGVIIAVYLLVIKVPGWQAKRTISRETKAAAQAIAALDQTQSSIANLPRVDRVSLQQVGSFRNYADEAKILSDKISKLNISHQAPKRIVGYPRTRLVSDTDELIDAVKTDQIFKSSDGHLDSAKKLTAYNAEISKALVNTLEYNPTEDTNGFRLGSDDTDKRLSLAQEGLAKTKQQLESIKSRYDYGNVAELIGYVQTMQAARDSLAKDGNSEAWIGAVDLTQQKIIGSLQGFWISNSAKTVNLLNGDLTKMTKLQSMWSQLKDKYQVK